MKNAVSVTTAVAVVSVVALSGALLEMCNAFAPQRPIHHFTATSILSNRLATTTTTAVPTARTLPQLPFRSLALRMANSNDNDQDDNDDDDDNSNVVAMREAAPEAPLPMMTGEKRAVGIRPPMEEFDVTGGRPGAIIETEEDLARKEEIFQELDTGERDYPEWFEDYGEREEDMLDADDDDPEAIDPRTLGKWDIFDLKSKFPYELDPSKGDEDPNALDPNERYVKEIPVDEDGVEIGWDPLLGSSNPIDERTIVGTVDSYMVDERTMNVTMQTPQFHPGDLEETLNEDVRKFRKSLDIIETFIDPFLSGVEVPRHTARWHGLPEPVKYPEKSYYNNRFTRDEDLIDFDAMTPYRARQKAVELARARNAPWLPEDVVVEYHAKKRAPYEAVGTVVGTLREGVINEELAEKIQPALKILGSCAKLLSMEGEAPQKIFRFHYFGLMKNRYGMECWTETLIRDCGVECTNVIFETGWRRRDHAYDGGFNRYGPCG